MLMGRSRSRSRSRRGLVRLGRLGQRRGDHRAGAADDRWRRRDVALLFNIASIINGRGRGVATAAITRTTVVLGALYVRSNWGSPIVILIIRVRVGAGAIVGARVGGRATVIARVGVRARVRLILRNMCWDWDRNRLGARAARGRWRIGSIPLRSRLRLNIVGLLIRRSLGCWRLGILCLGRLGRRLRLPALGLLFTLRFGRLRLLRLGLLLRLLGLLRLLRLHTLGGLVVGFASGVAV